MKFYKFLVSILFSYGLLELMKYTVLLFFLLTDDDIYYFQNINTNSFSIKVGLSNYLPIYLGILYILTHFVVKLYKRRKLDFLNFFSLIISLTLYIFFDFRKALFFIDNWKLKLLLSYVLLILIMIVIKRLLAKLTMLSQS
ncbi:hypothetical protein SAMN05421741_11413 [Paenimyroides ummariense]|uniref:Uncharacterized protein n=1 Tax=Paenimyroides ummariense TaxID=913024 RepID=A0A1I5D0J4_9FLAO|nr:hypothetical protein SAMN05421741_11413 [Paenimyroides ummariense]